MQNVLGNFSKADIEDMIAKFHQKKLEHCIQKAYCQCSWQRILVCAELSVRIFTNRMNYEDQFEY